MRERGEGEFVGFFFLSASVEDLEEEERERRRREEERGEKEKGEANERKRADARKKEKQKSFPNLPQLTVKQPHEPALLDDRVRLHQLLARPLVRVLGGGNVAEDALAVEGPAVVGTDDARVALAAFAAAASFAAAAAALLARPSADVVRHPALVQRRAAVRAHVGHGLDAPLVPCVAEEGEAAPERGDAEGFAVVLDLLAEGDGVPKVLQVGPAAAELSGAAAQGIGWVEGARGQARALAALGEGGGGRVFLFGGSCSSSSVVVVVVFVGPVAAALQLPLLLSREKGLGLLLQRRRQQRRNTSSAAGDLDGPRDGRRRGGRGLLLRRGLEHGRRRERRRRFFDLRRRQRRRGARRARRRRKRRARRQRRRRLLSLLLERRGEAQREHLLAEGDLFADLALLFVVVF